MKPVAFLGRSLESLKGFPATVRQEAGYELDKVQRGVDPKDWKTMPDLGTGVREIRIRVRGAWRVVYVANRPDAAYVLHAFQKKTLRTSVKDIAIIKSSLRELK